MVLTTNAAIVSISENLESRDKLTFDICPTLCWGLRGPGIDLAVLQSLDFSTELGSGA